jgi:hypothetical protein
MAVAAIHSRAEWMRQLVDPQRIDDPPQVLRRSPPGLLTDPRIHVILGSLQRA